MAKEMPDLIIRAAHARRAQPRKSSLRQRLLSRLALPVALSAAGLAAPGHAFELASVEEARASMQALRAGAANTSAPAKLRSLELSSPRIEVVNPDLAAADALRSPLPVEVRFHAAAGARIRAESFRAYYGMFRIDVTERLLKHASVSARGIRVEDAELPRGEHSLVLYIEDDAARVGEREIRFSITE